MEARDFAELLKDDIQACGELGGDKLDPLGAIDTRWGYGDADFFVETDDGTFLVTVAKVAE